MDSVADKKHLGGPSRVEDLSLKAQSLPKECPSCGAKTKLYRTPRGLRCADCVKKQDSAGLSFR